MNFSAIDFPGRIQAVARQLNKRGLVAYVGTRQAALHYLKGAFMPWRGAMIVTAKGESECVYWAMDADRATKEGAPGPMHVFQFDQMVALIGDRLRELGIQSGRVGLDLSHPGAAQVAPGMLTASEYLELTQRNPNIEFVNGVDALDEPMLLKSPGEIERLREVGRVATVGMRAGAAAIAVGVTENHVAGCIEAATRDQGSVWAWAVTGGTEVGSGERTAYMRGLTQQASDKRIARDEFVILDLHPMVDCYLSDFALPVFFGKPTQGQKAVIDCFESVARVMIDSLVPGRPIAQCVQMGIDEFARHGMQEFGLPLFGHGLGIDARTRPFINLRSSDTVQIGMAAALGTHLYVPGVGGARMEYPIVITSTGAEPLVDLPPRCIMIP